MRENLTHKVHKVVKKYCAKGDKLADKKKFVKAQECYSKAWDALPEPKLKWDASNWILAAQMDAAFLSHDIALSRHYLRIMQNMNENIGNPFFHLRNGQCYFLEGNEDAAANELIRAYALEGPEMFGENQKYLEFLATKAEGISIP